uniref:Uncharacterized protein n=1 Tax=Anguilla anguilla TaxID=7936 RepID=A0A0E9U966_ANGAN
MSHCSASIILSVFVRVKDIWDIKYPWFY